MMQGFSDVTVSWKGEEYIIPADKQLTVVAMVEDALAGDSGEQAIFILLRPSGPPFARVAMAFGAMLRFAGAKVSNDEIYLSLMNDLSKGKADAVNASQSAIMALLSVVSPPMWAALTQPIGAGTKKKKDSPKAD